MTKDVEPYSIVGGNPAKVIRKRFSDSRVEKLINLKCWNYGPEILNGLNISDIERCLPELEERINSKQSEIYQPAFVVLDTERNSIIINDE